MRKAAPLKLSQTAALEPLDVYVRISHIKLTGLLLSKNAQDHATKL